MRAAIDEGGLPVVAYPLIASSLTSQLSRFFIIHGLFSLVVPSFVVGTVIKGKLQLYELRKIYRAISEAHYNPVNKLPEFQDKDLLRQLWKAASARPYIEGGALEYQEREGYCNSATMRCTLKSFPSFPHHKLPPQRSESGDPNKWKGLNAWEIDEDNDSYKLQNESSALEKDAVKSSSHMEVFPGSCAYSEFLSAIKRGLEDPNCRIVLNYLRPVLFGFAMPWWLPSNLFLALVGGHFSPIIGVIETEKYKGDNPLIGVFDVNHRYGGAYLVPAKSLYRSVQTMDVSSQKPRAITLIHEPNRKME